MSSSRPSRNLDSEQTENEFDNHVNPIPLPPSRSPLNSIPDPSQNPRENQESESDSRGKLGSTRTKKTETWSSNATPKSRVTKVSNGGGGNGSRSHKDSRGGNGTLSKVSRGILSVGTDGFTDVPHFELVEDPSFWLDHNVQVLIRIRPISSSERALQGNARCLRQDNSQTLTWLGHPETRFTFDHIACESISQEKLFKVAGLPMVENCMSGYNSCMFAYGQTGSGKTYTMMGEIHELDGMLSEDCGMTPRIFEYLFMRIRAEEHRRNEEKLKYSCKCSFLEIYNEHITDLLEPSSTNLQIREDMRKGVYVENLTEYEVTTVKDVLQLLLKGATNRKMAATNMNSESSRSHSVFTCIIESRWDIDTMTHFRFGRLNLVDLAGSERQKSSGAEGERLKEAANINKSLSTLGMVINTLVVVAHGKHRHVPYRDSRLTFLLQDSLGGNSKTTIIANISPSTCSANETLSTLKFAQRAKLIQNNAKVNEDASGDVMALQRQIQQLKDQLTFLLKQQSFSGSLSSSVPDLEKSKFGDIVETYDSFSKERISDQYNTSIPEEKIRCIKATLVGALRREKMTETAMRRLEAEIEHMNRLVHQQEEDAQRTKMIIRFREEKIKRLESLSDGLVSADEYLMEENNALSEEIQLLQEKIDRNPELTRFALENLRLLEHLRTYEDFYEQGEREIMIAEVSELRDQLMETLKGTHVKLKSSLQVPNQEQDKNIKKELEDCRRNLEACLEINEKLTREVDQSRRELNFSTKHSGTAFDPPDNSLCVDSGVLQETDKDSLADTISARTDYEDEIASYSHLQTLNDQKMGNALALPLSDAQKELMDARSLIEALEHQQLYLMEELDVLQNNCHYVESVNEDSKERQSQLILGNDHGASEGHQKIVGLGLQNVGLSMEGSGAIITSDFPSKLDRLNKELEEARILNLQYQDDRASQVFRQNEAELVCQQVEVETAQTILHLQEEVTSLQHEFKEKLVFMTEENTRLINYIQIRENEMRIMSENWEKAVLELTSFLSEGCRSLEDASDHIKSIASSFYEREVGIGEHVERAVKIFVERERTIMQLKKSLEDAQDMCMELRSKVSSLQGATLAVSEVQQLENDESTREVIALQTLLRENISKVMELESKLKSVEEKTAEAERHTDIEFFRMKSLSDFPSYARRRFSGDLDSPSSDQDKYKTSETIVEADSQAVDTIQVQVGVDEKRGSDHFIVSQTARQLQSLKQSLGIAEADCSNTREMLHLREADARLISDKKIKMNCRFLRKFEEAHATLVEADLMLNALLKANENAKIMTDTWKQKGEELMIERIGLTEEVQQLKSSIVLKEGEYESMQDQMHGSLVELSELVSLLEESFVQMKRDVEERFKELYSYVASFGQDVFDCFCSSRASLEDVLSQIVEKGFTLFVLFQCYAGSSFKEILSLESGPDLLRHKQQQCYSILNNTKREFNLTTDNLMSENLLLKAELARKDDILKGLLFDISLLQESTSNSKDIKDETEQMLIDLTRVQHELAMKATQLDDILFKHRQLEARLVDTEAALSISNSELVQAKKTLDVFSKKNGDLSALLEELHANKTTTEEQVEEQKEVVKGLEKEILRIAFSVEERVVSSIKSIEEDLRRVTKERDYLLEEVASLNDKLEMANTLSDENEAIAVEARQESEASKVYAEEKEEEAKILERSVEELEHTINVLEKKVYEMGEEVQRHHVMRDDLELELQGLRRRMLVVQNVTENMNTENLDVEQKVVIDRLVECEELRKHVTTLEKERTDQAREIKECREYISELVLHSEAQASQYQQKYKMLEDMVHEIKRDPSLSASAPSTLDKTEKFSIRTRGSSSPFRCIASLVQQMSVEKDQELSVARLQIEELEALASSRQKEVCMLNARLAAADNMTHDVIRDLLGVKLDMTNYANFIDQHQVQKLVEGAQRKTEEYIAKEQEILQLRKQIEDLVEERQSCIEELNEREGDILAARVTLEQLKQRDQMLKAQNEILKMDKAKLKRKITEMDEMLRKQCGPPSVQQPTQETSKRQESCSLKASRDDLGNRLTNSEKHLSRVNNELAWYYESDIRDHRETDQSARNKRQASAQEPEHS